MFSKTLFPEALPTWALFLELTAAALVVILSGARFTRLADTLADRLNLTGGWVGLLLLATVTSLPELVTGGTATAIGNVDLAFGGILGSCCFNITLIVLLNAMLGGGSVLRSVSPQHILTSSFGILLIGLSLVGLVLGQTFAARPGVARAVEIGWAVVIFVTYLGCLRLVHRFDRALGESAGELPLPDSVPPGRSLYLHIAAMALVIVLASWWLAKLGDVLSTHHIELIGRPLGATFVGAVFLAVSTSLPEIVTSIAAVRLGNVDLALGNIFGSNMFNIFVMPFLKVVSLAYGQPLLIDAAAVHTSKHLLTGLVAILLTAIAVGGLAYKSRRRMLRRFGVDSILIAIVYVGGMLVLLAQGD